VLSTADETDKKQRKRGVDKLTKFVLRAALVGCFADTEERGVILR